MAHVVVVGAGIGGLPMAFELRERVRPEDRVTLVSDRQHFEFVPSNPWIAVNWRRRGEVELPIRSCLANKKIDFVPTAVRRVHPAEKHVELADGRSLSYDFLVIATGAQLAFDEVPGLGPQAHTLSICRAEHAERAAEAWEAFLRDPGPIVVGAAQGASCFGPAYEFVFILDTDLRRRGLRHKVDMTFVTPEPYLGHLGLAGVGDSQAEMESAMRRSDIRWVCNARIDRVDPALMHVTECEGNGGQRRQMQLPFRHAMIIPAFRGVEAVEAIEGLTDRRGFVLVDEFQRNPSYPDIYAVGVCVAIPPVEETPVPTAAPKTGYMIETMVQAAALNIRACIDGREPAHTATWNAICLADFGDTGVAFVALPQFPPRSVNWSREGKWVRLAKVAFEKYFLRKMRRGATDPLYEKYVLSTLGIRKTAVRQPSSQATH